MANVTKQFSIMGSTLRPGGNQNASTMIGRLKIGQGLTLLRQPKNPVDPNAVFVMWGTWPLGYLPRGLAETIAPLMDSGVRVICRKARNALYGVCDLAYIEPDPVLVTEAELLSVEQANELYPTKEVPDDDEPSAATLD